MLDHEWYRIQGFLFVRATLMVVSFGLIAAVGIGLVAALFVFVLLRATAPKPNAAEAVRYSAPQRVRSVPGPRHEGPVMGELIAERGYPERGLVVGRHGPRRHVADLYAELEYELSELEEVFPLQVARAMQNPRRRPGLVRTVRAAEAAAEVEMDGQVADAEAFVARRKRVASTVASPQTTG
jgi:hypothetical protein